MPDSDTRNLAVVLSGGAWSDRTSAREPIERGYRLTDDALTANRGSAIEHVDPR